jgi:hypothetical protein
MPAVFSTYATRLGDQHALGAPRAPLGLFTTREASELGRANSVGATDTGQLNDITPFARLAYDTM